MGLSLTAKSAVWALVDVKDGTILADEVVTLDSANEIARATARSIQAFALQSQRDIDGVRLTWSDDARAHGIRLRTKLRLFGFDTVETVTPEAAREGRNRTARHIAPHLVLAYGAARADLHGDEHRNVLSRLVSRVPLPVSAAAGVIAVAGVGIYALTGGFTASTPVTEASAPAPAPAAVPSAPPVPAAAPVPAPVAGPVAAPETFSPVESARSFSAPADVTPAEEEPQASTATPVAATIDETVQPAVATPQTATASQTGTVPATVPATVPISVPITTVQEFQQPSTASVAAVGITPSDPQTIDTMIGEPHLTGSQLAAGPVQAVVAPAPVQSAQPVPASTATPGGASQTTSEGPLSAFLEALP
ncbi:hypothetical protein [Mycobacterium kyogaense]|uniref:hypothetical protein n=1 Tax=Mycobacterium kyogaense TaxID=2212479 RepID=UPI0019699B94|nr:hypothetical protein [Mycobacterium kyogaense]